MVIDGPASLILSGSNDYSGGTTVESGCLCIAASAALPAGGSLIIGAGGTLIFDPSAAGAPAELVSLPQVHTASEIVAVPEPGTLALALAFWIAVACRRFSRRRARNFAVVVVNVESRKPRTPLLVAPPYIDACPSGYDNRGCVKIINVPLNYWFFKISCSNVRSNRRRFFSSDFVA